MTWRPPKEHPWRVGLALSAGGSRNARRPGHSKTPACEGCGVMATLRLSLVYDHDHGTGKHRGWLCHGCNSALGFAGDNPQILQALAKYLESTSYSVTRELTASLSCPPPVMPVQPSRFVPGLSSALF